MEVMNSEARRGVTRRGYSRTDVLGVTIRMRHNSRHGRVGPRIIVRSPQIIRKIKEVGWKLRSNRVWVKTKFLKQALLLPVGLLLLHPSSSLQARETIRPEWQTFPYPIPELKTTDVDALRAWVEKKIAAVPNAAWSESQIKEAIRKAVAGGPKAIDQAYGTIVSKSWSLHQLEGRLSKELQAELLPILAHRESTYASPPRRIRGGTEETTRALEASYAWRIAPSKSKRTEAWARAYLDHLIQHPDWVADNGLYYGSRCLWRIPIIGMLGRRERELKQKHLRPWFDEAAAVVMPNGLIPGYGEKSAEWEVENWPYILEMGAMIFRDKKMRALADQCYAAAFAYDTPAFRLQKSKDARRGYLISQLGAVKPELPRRQSEIIRNRDQAPEKLVLRTGDHILSSWLLMDFSTRTGSQPAHRGSIIAYYTQGVPYLIGHGGSNRASDRAGLVLVPPGKPFPGSSSQLNLKPGAKADAGLASRNLLANCVLSSAEVDIRPPDAAAVLKYSDYFSPGTTLRKTIVLTPEGYLLIRDELIPGAAANGFTAGAVWYNRNWAAEAMQPVDETAFMGTACTGKDWKGNTYSGRSLILHPPTKGQKAGSDGAASFVQQRLATDQPAVFTTVVAPFPVVMDAEIVRKSVQAIAVAGGSSVTFKRTGKPVNLTIDAEGWRVTRGGEGALAIQHISEAPKEINPKRARTYRVGAMDKVDGILLPKLVKMSKARTLPQRPVKFAGLAERIQLQRITELGEIHGHQSGEPVTLTFADITLIDKAGLAALVSVAEPENKLAFGLTGFYLEGANQKALANQMYKKAGAEIRGKLDLLFESD